MLVAFLIMLREGIEAALIVGIIAGYLRQLGRSEWMPYVWGGVGLALGICLLLGAGLTLTRSEFPQRAQELFAGTVAIVAAAMLTSMVLWMKKASCSIMGELHGSIDAALRPGSGQKRALVATAFFATGREGVETVFFLLATFQQDVGVGAPVGAVLGLITAIAIGAAFATGSVRLNLRVFFRWTGVLIVFVAAGLLASSLRSFHDAGLWNGLQATAFDLSETLPADGVAGTLLSSFFGYQDAPSLGEVLIYLAYLVPALWVFLTPFRGTHQIARTT